MSTLSLLRQIAEETLERCSRTMRPDPNGREYRIHVPAGDMKYPSFWIRDAAMMAESLLIDAEELFDWIEIVCRYGQNGPNPRKLAHGLAVLPWSIADHVNFDGGAVFYPGTYESGDDQGNGTFGFYPPHGDQYFFLHMIYLYYRLAGSSVAKTTLTQEIAGVSPLDRAERAYSAHQLDEVTGLCTGHFPDYVVDWGFCDSIRKSGYLLFPSILRFEAGVRLAEVCRDFGMVREAESFEGAARRIRDSIGSIFVAPDGWLISATETCREPDVWGTAYAVSASALSPEIEARAVDALLDAYRSGTISADGYVRHVPLDRDFSSETAWERAAPGFKLDHYQNGGFWATPAGWVAHALSRRDRSAAHELLRTLVEHTEKDRDDGRPYEWKTADDATFSGRYYGTSAALPYAGAQRIEEPAS